MRISGVDVVTLGEPYKEDMRYEVLFDRHGLPDALTFDTERDAETFADWLWRSGAGTDADVIEVD